MMNMATTETCDKCGLSYYTSLIPHECAEWTKGRSGSHQTAQQPTQPAPDGEPWHRVNWFKYQPYYRCPQQLVDHIQQTGGGPCYQGEQACAICGAVLTNTVRPMLDSNEWSQFEFDRRRVLNSSDGRTGVVVAQCDDEQRATQIVAEHNAVAFARRSGSGWTLIDWQNWLSYHATTTTQPDAGEG